MKKIFALMLAMALLLCSVSALAATESKQETPTSTWIEYPPKDDTFPPPKKTSESEITSKFLEPNAATQEAIKGIEEKGVDFFPDEIKAQIPEGYTEFNEIVTYLLDGVPAGTNSLTLNYVFDTPYKAGEIVLLAIGIPQADGTTEWILTEGVVQDDVSAQQEGSVNVTLTQDIIEKIAGKEVIIVVISEKAE